MSERAAEIFGSPCGLGRRLLAIAYDCVVVAGLLLLAAALALPLDFLGQQAFRDPLFTLYLAGVWFMYESWCWRRAGMTLGMRAWQIRLLTADGRPLGWGWCLLRFVTGIAGAAALGAGLLWSLADRQKRCWHDLAAGTRLVRCAPRSDGTP
jgi:uncharacterized RDD family membrane protein YckC